MFQLRSCWCPRRWHQASAKRKERTLNDLYNLTRIITQPEVTPVLRGSFRMQGPVDETCCDIQTNMELFRDEKGLGRHSKSQKVLMRTESGMCNVCSAPCSSCLHINRTLMGSKNDEFSDETCDGNAYSQHSVNDVVPGKSTACDVGWNATSETSNLLSVSSNHDSFSENAESKACLRTSDASKDVEMHPKFSYGVTAGDNQLPSKPQCKTDERALANKLENRKVIEGHGDSVSCVSGGNDTNKLASHDNGNVIRKMEPHSSASAKLSSHQIDLIGIHSSKDRSDVNSPCPFGSKSHSCNVRELEDDLGSQLIVELPQLSKEHLNSSLTKEAASDMTCGRGSAPYACGGIEDGRLLGGNSTASDTLCIIVEGEAETDKGSDDLPARAVNFQEQIEGVLPDLQETSLFSQDVDDSDGSDIVEHDVKVCDICGDAGREDLLAICSRCSDGAEHTYCMREMVDKVPEGDWFCEECKFDEEIKNLKQDKTVAAYGSDKTQSSGLATALNTNAFVKLDKKDSDDKTNTDIPKEKVSSKRYAENIEVASAVKRQVLEPTVGSPKTSSPSRIAALSRDSSFKTLDKGKMKPVHPLSSGTCATIDSSKAALSPTGSRLQTPRGTLLKSNSFSSTNAKPKVKLVDEVVLQKQKSARDLASLDVKEGANRSIGKSISFKSVNPGRLNPSESKVKMLSPKFSHGQDIKGLKPAKEWNLLERKNSFKSERSVVSSAVGNNTFSVLKSDKKIASCGESYPLPSVSNNREPKGVQSNSKSSTLSKSTSFVARRGSGVPGELKMQSCALGVAGASSANEISSFAEQKPNQTSLMYDQSSEFTAERPFCNADEGLPVVVPQPQESTNLGEKIRDSSIYHSRPSSTAGGSAPCKKCKEIGHSAQLCPVENPRSLLGDASAAKSSREVMDKDNKLKAAIEAAMLKKPVIYRKNKMPYQSDELSMSNTSLSCETRSLDQLSTPISTRNNFSAEVVHEGHAVLRNSIDEFCKQATVNNTKHLSVLPSEAAMWKTGDNSLIDPSDGKPFINDLPSHASSAVPVLLKMSIIPEHEYIWQGVFEVQSNRRCPELHDGIQAHLSTCASSRALEVAKNFPSKILLNEVPRSSTWPLQFQEFGVREDNIALYFFAKDLESYDESYRSLLETMIKNDLALKGNFDGVELLIFPSNHLPEKSQRWNMLYFLWGVFRGKKVNCLQDASGTPKKYCMPEDLPATIISLPETMRSLGPTDGDLRTCSKVYYVALGSECPASMESPCLSSETINEDCDTSKSCLDPKGQCTQANARQQDCNVDATPLPSIQRTSAMSFQETRCTCAPLEDNVDPDCKLHVKRLPSVQDAGPIRGLKKNDKMPTFLSNATDCLQNSSCSFEIRGGVNSSENLVTYERTLKEKERYLDTKTVMQRQKMMRDDETMKEVNTWQNNHGKRLHEDSAWTGSQASAGGSQMSSWNDGKGELLDGGCASKKQKTGYSELYVCNSSSSTNPLRESFTLGTQDMSTSSQIKEDMCKEACNERDVSRNNGSAERYFFPVDPHPATKDFNSGGKSLPWKVFSSENDDRLPDGAPNLELALGADMESSKQGILPFLMGKPNLKDDQEDQPAEKAATTKEAEEDVSACLSLSLSFPFPDKEGAVEHASKVEQLRPDDRRQVNTSLLLFKGLSDE
ncbi:uncharacterized protein LOC130752582 isoform X3 [Actinidia eriantha]|uniref:uncharacterized protein LOC130752582 isoform X3 n=1 Tax=Actinidia eriantha TaxID=165200 RepID=UPI00258C15FD|nr:uncharacterized protein LOC130752582 isoform X3 [Actinidia eriantha]